MNTIKYIQLFTITIIVCILTIHCWRILCLINKYKIKSLNEGFIDRNEYENIDNELGLPLSATNTMEFRNNTSYSEIDESEIRKLLFPLTNMVLWANELEPVDKLLLTDTDLLKLITLELLSKINKKDNEDSPFTVIKQYMISKNATKSNEIVTLSKHIIYRDGKMYGFIILVETLWTKDDLKLKGFTKVEPTGIILQDKLSLLDNEYNASTFRSYGDNLSFIQGEAIMKDKKYEDDILQKQTYDLLQDRGISAKSLQADAKK